MNYLESIMCRSVKIKLLKSFIILSCRSLYILMKKIFNLDLLYFQGRYSFQYNCINMQFIIDLSLIKLILFIKKKNTCSKLLKLRIRVSIYLKSINKFSYTLIVNSSVCFQ